MARFASLNRNTDFRTVYYLGKSQVDAALVTYAKRNREGVTRVGITVGKRIGGAVRRNRCRRVIREAYRALLPRVNRGWDIVFVARRRAVFLKSTEIRQIMESQLKALGVLKQ